ncbi:MAG: hypothetical protein ACPGRH_02570 [Alphaproteobacteria bacterium]
MQTVVMQTDVAAIVVATTAKLYAAMMVAVTKIVTTPFAKWKNRMDYFLVNPKPKPLTEDELLALFSKSEEKAKANSKNQQTKSCGCCSSTTPKK